MGILNKYSRNELLDKSNIAFGVFKVLTDENGAPYDFEFSHVNTAMAELEKLPAGKLTGKKFSSLHNDIAKDWAEMLYPAAYENKHIERKNYLDSLNILAQIYAFPIEKGICGAFLKNFTREIDGVIKSITGKDVCVFYYNIDSDILIADSTMVERFGGRTHYEGLINAFALELVDEAYVDVLRSELETFPNENRFLETNLKLKSGKYIHFALTADADNKDDKLALGYIEDVSHAAALAREAELDSLTGLYHSVAARTYIDKEAAECAESDRVDAFLLIDLDGFAAVNENLGYDKGDELLKNYAEIIRNNFKGKDILARPGGDEFIIYVSDINDKRSALLICRTLNKILSESVKCKNGDNIKITASIGVAFPGDNGSSYDELVKNAKGALKEAKANGKNGYSLA